MGADAVVLAGHSVDPYNGKCLRASAGSIFAIPVVSETDAGGAVSALAERAACGCWPPPSTARVSLDDADLSGPTAWLFGPESHGLPAELAAMAADRVRIPMAGAPRASMWRRPRRSACTRARGRTECNAMALND